MPVPNPDALAFLLSRRSRPAKTLDLPIPDRDQLEPILTAAARVPDHGKLEPWRFIVLERAALERLAVQTRHRASELGLDEEKTDKGAKQFEQGHLAVVVVEINRPSEKIPRIEQTYSAGAACLGLLNAALASGWGANWLSGWPSHDGALMQKGLGLGGDERVAGIIYLGTERSAPPERPRPDLNEVVTWQSE